MRSPLAKRKRIAAGRTGASKLKQSMSVGDLGRSPTPTLAQHIGSSRTSLPNDENNDGDDEDDGDDEFEDFLAHEMGEDWS